MKKFVVSSPCFENGGLIPVEHTGYGADQSPELVLEGLRDDAKFLAITLDDLGHPIPAYNHWIIWNLPAMSVVPGGIPHGKQVASLDNAVQGCGYGKNCYKGPKPPFHCSHVYRFRVFALDCMLDLPSTTRKRKLLAAIQGHILQQAELMGHFR